MGKYLAGTSTAIVLGALTGGIIIGVTGGKGLASAAFGTVTGAVSGGIAGSASLIPTNTISKTCLKTAIVIPLTATVTLMTTLFILNTLNPEKSSIPRSPSDDSWRELAYIMLWMINSLTATMGSISAQCIGARREKHNQKLLETTLDNSELKLN